MNPQSQPICHRERAWSLNISFACLSLYNPASKSCHANAATSPRPPHENGDPLVLTPQDEKKRVITEPPPTVQPSQAPRSADSSTIRLLVPCPRTRTAKLLGLAAAVVGDEEGAVVLHKRLLERVLAVLVDELLVVGDQAFGDRLADGVNLRRVATAGDPYPDVDLGELVEADDQERLVDLFDGPLDHVPFPCMLPFSLRLRRPFVVIGLEAPRDNRTLNRRISGCTSWRGLPLTLMRPFPLCERHKS